MTGKNVKNTIFERLLQFIAPHYCCGCGKIGVFLCQECKNDIVFEPFLGCIQCGGALCPPRCKRSLLLWVVGVRHAVLKRAINEYKFQHNKAAATHLAQLITRQLPFLPSETVVVPVPTVSRHIRNRGYDHAAVLAKAVALQQGLLCAPLLRRIKHSTQHTAGRAKRLSQAKGSFIMRPQKGLLPKQVLLIDDIITTGATVKHAAEVLQEQGITVCIAALAYQPLD